MSYTNWDSNTSTDYSCLIKNGNYVDDSDDGTFVDAATDNPLDYTGKWTSCACDNSHYFICQSE